MRNRYLDAALSVAATFLAAAAIGLIAKLWWNLFLVGWGIL